MVIGILQMDLFLGSCQSLKEKRMILNRLKTRMRNNFNASVSELDHHEKWQRTVIAVAAIGNERRPIDAMLANIVEFVRRDRSVEIIDYSVEML
jgi:uncharacterized protein YlxP (DUF503 family)